MQQSLVIGGTVVRTMTADEALDVVIERARRADGSPMAVASANLDHVHHFGCHGLWPGVVDGVSPARDVEWISLLDGAPLVAQARRLTGAQWPRLAGSDLAEPILDGLEAEGLSVGFVGGSAETHVMLASRIARRWPRLRLAGTWAPSRESLADPAAGWKLAEQIRQSACDVLVVCMGKPRQELWIAEYAKASGARVLLAFGAVVDFLAGRVQRSPRWASDHGLEWAWRLGREPRRLARRYLVQGPPAYLDVRLGSRRFQDGGHALVTPPNSVADVVRPGFVTVDEEADVVVGIVTYNSRRHLHALFASLRQQATDLRIRVVVADNLSTDGSLERASAEPGVLAFSTGGNLGYAAAINEICHRWRKDCPLLVLNPDLVVSPGSVKAMLARLTGKIGVVVPLLLNEDGSVYHSLRHEPALLGAAGDAVFGSHFQARGHRLSETNFRPECYRYAHAVDWATGAALLISPAVAERVGDWDDRFFLYSEETDFLRRVRAAGWGVWFEPQAAMTHRGGGSGSSSELTALMAVNKLRYAEKHHSRSWSVPFRALLIAGACARAGEHDQRAALTMLLSRRRWPALPHATTPVDEATPADVPRGAIVIPAHNEEKVIARLLSRVSGLAESGRVQVVVACNGCTDDTAGIALSFPGVTVVKIDEPSKVAALNAAERVVDQFPRLYVDADVEISPSAVGSLFRHLEAGASQAARPVASYDVSASSRLVRCYFRARGRANVGSQALWGAGAYALSETGRSRFGDFPDVVADDLFVDRLFTASEKTVIDGPPVIVRVPRDTKTLVSVLGRTLRGSAELRSTGPLRGIGPSPSGTLRQLVTSVRSPLGVLDAAVYVCFSVWARMPTTAPSPGWKRDESSRH